MAIALVNQTELDSAAGSATTPITIPSTTAGNMLLAIVWESAASTAVNPVLSDDHSGTWTSPPNTTATNGPPPVDSQSGVNSFVSCAYALNIAAGITTVTVTWSATSKINGVSITEWSGVATSSAVDVSIHGGGGTAGTTATATSLTQLNANDLVVFAIEAPATTVLNTAGSSPTTGWNALTGSTQSTNHGAADYQVFSATAARAVSWTLGSSVKSGMIGIAFKQAAAASPVTATPAVAALALTTFAPQIQLGVIPATAALTLTTFAPQLQLGVIPPTAALTLTTFAPTINIGVNVIPATASLTLSSFAPTIALSDNKVATPSVAALSLSSFAPTIAVSDNKLATPSVRALSLTTFAPTVSVSDNKLATIGTAALSLTAFAPNVVASDLKRVTPTTASLTITGLAPSVLISNNQMVIPATAVLTLATYAPTVSLTLAAPVITARVRPNGRGYLWQR